MAKGDPFHADLSIASGTAAGVFTVFDPQAAAIRVRHIRVSSDAATRFVVGTQDSDGFRMAAGYLPAGGSGYLADVDIFTAGTGMLSKALKLWTGSASGIEIQIDGCYEQ